ncbi:c-type cytochrome [Sphingobium olei]|uniref:C-type cytochrome n=1 Tax=Sphingobium olei TaxID=420955 RepID=A0ABW3NVR3_9SPHN
MADPAPDDLAPDAASTRRERHASTARTAVLAVAGGTALFVLGSIFIDTGLIGHADTNRDVVASEPAAFSPPPMSSIPAGPEGDAIRRGMQIFLNPGTNAREFVGNSLACKNCHLDAGRKPDSAPMWAAWVAYPKYRSKNKQINTMEDRVKGCFTYSMNAQDGPSGKPPPPGSDIYKDLEVYFHWLAKNAPTGVDMEGAGYPEPTLSAAGYDPVRGAQVYSQNCAACHGSDGQGRQDINGRVVFPPLWGPRSYNWGAGMARIDNAAGFIKANMPLGQGNRLSDQQAWDVAAFVNSHERPKDPRQTGGR